jgi:electron transport complex protein RnfE
MKEGLITNNPIFVQLLGMCPTLATTTSLVNGLGMGLAATAVLVCSNLLISLLRKVISREVRIACYITIISGFVTAVELLMKAFFFELYGSLGLFIPLIVVNCIIFGRAEAFASRNPVIPSVFDGLFTGLGFTGALCIIGFIRELLGTGKILGRAVLPGYSPAVIFILPAGAFFTLGFIIAAVQKFRNVRSDRGRFARLSNVSEISGIPSTLRVVDENYDDSEFIDDGSNSAPSDPDSDGEFELDFYPDDDSTAAYMEAWAREEAASSGSADEAAGDGTQSNAVPVSETEGFSAEAFIDG